MFIPNFARIEFISHPTRAIPILPASPVLSDIAPNPNLNGTIILWWSASAGQFHNVYCYTDLITSINSSLYLVSNIGITSEIDSGLTNGTYYYAITAINASGVSNVSNCQSVTMAIPPPSSLSITATPALLNGIFYVFSNSCCNNYKRDSGDIFTPKTKANRHSL